MFSVLRKLVLAYLFCLLAGSFCAAQKASGFFRVEQRNGVWWLMTPEGKPFFSSGVNVIDEGESRAQYDPKNPAYASFRFYKTDKEWQDTKLQRLREWNFNTIGGWSDEDLERRGEMPYVKAFYWGEKLVPWTDVFNEKTESAIEEKIKAEVSGLKDDKNLIGYFSDNELEWWDDTIFYHYLGQPEENKTRQVLMNLFRRFYKNNFAALRRDFNTGAATDFTSLAKEKSLTLKPNGGGVKLIDEFVFLIADHYYKTVHDAIRRYDPNHLFMGDRYPSWYSQAVVRAAAPYVDVISTNYMADWTDGNFSRFYLDSLHRLTNKPVIVTEYYIAANQNRSGNKNSNNLFPTVETQAERAASFRTNLTKLAEIPYVVGAHWFQYCDEPPNGRKDGEDYNMGLVDINDRPYEELTGAAKAIDPAKIHARRASQKTTSFIPKAPAAVEKGLREWNKADSFVPASAGGGTNLPFADLYASWDEKNLYLAVYAMDYTDLRIYPNSQLPDGERMTWTFKVGASSKPLKIHFGYGGAAESVGEPVEFKSFGDSTRFTILVKLPASKFGKKLLAGGSRIALSAKLESHSRAETMQWNQDLRLADRSGQPGN